MPKMMLAGQRPSSSNHLLSTIALINIPLCESRRLCPFQLTMTFLTSRLVSEMQEQQAIELAGWRVRDLAGNVWNLDGLFAIAAGKTKTLLRNGASMSLTNGGDEKELVAPDGAVVATYCHCLRKFGHQGIIALGNFVHLID